MILRIFTLKAKGKPYDGFQIRAASVEFAEKDAKYMFNLDGVEWRIEDIEQFKKEEE